MKLYLSSYCIGPRDYSWLLDCVTGFEKPIGVEFAVGFPGKNPDPPFLAQESAFSGVPILLHAPYAEFCTEPGSKEELEAEQEFQKTCQLYQQFHAASVVFHTHEGPVPDEQRLARQKQSAQVLSFWAPLLRERNMRGTVENVGYPARKNVLFSQEEFIALFEILPPEWGCLIDTGHALLNHWDLPEVIQKLGSRIHGYHLNQNDGVHDSHLSYYAPEGIISKKEADQIIQAAAFYSPNANLILEYGPYEWICKEGIYEDFRQICQAAGC